MEIRPIGRYTAELHAPPDKSITHRAVMFNALAGGRAVVKNALLGEDCLHTAECMRRLGAHVEIDGADIAIEGAALWSDGRARGTVTLDAGNSGTTIRLLAGALAGVAGTFSLDGDASLRSRPMRRVIEPLSRMGASVASADGRAPLVVRGAPLTGIEYAMPVASAQVKSAVLLAGMQAEGRTTVTEPAPSRDHTERMLKAMGADIRREGAAVSVTRSPIRPIDITVCGDISGAAYPLVLAACIEGSCVTVRDVGINPTRSGLLDVLHACGAEIGYDNLRDGAEPSADVTLRYAAPKPFVIDGDLVPRLIDEIPALAVLACFAEGESVVRNAAELKVKESDRIRTVTDMLRALGGDVTPTDDGMIIRGKGYLPGGGTVDAGLDHRIAMSAAVAMAASRRGGTLVNGEVCAVSYPGFFSEVLAL